MSVSLTDRQLSKLAMFAFGAISFAFVGVVVFSFVNANAMNNSSWGSPGLVPNLLFLVVTYMFPLMGCLVASRQPRNSVGWVLLATGFVWVIGMFMDNYVGYAIFTNPGALPRPDVVEALTSGGWIPAIGLMGIYLVVLFPDGHLPSKRWRAFSWSVGVSMVLAWIAVTFAPGTFADSGYPHLTNPLGIDSLASILDPLAIFIAVIPIGFVASAVGLIKKFRRSRGQQRLQMKWFAAAAAGTALIYLIVMLLTFNRPTTGWVEWAQNLALFSFALIPVGTGIAILKYRLYEIDRLINRTLVYGLLTAVLGAIYLVVVVGLQGVLAPITESSDLAVAASTLAVAGLFGPIRKRIQSFIDRRFYRKRFDATKTVAHFGERLKDAIDLGGLESDLVRVVTDTMQPAHVSLWLRPTEDQG
jgi:hypothetical protein